MLMKPRIILLLLITTVTAMFMAEEGIPSWRIILLTLVAGSMAAGGANAINQFLESDIDALMSRTKSRPLPSKRLSGRVALILGIGLNAAAVITLALWINTLAASLALIGTLFYIFVYTLWLKRTTSQNIVIGGAAGAVPPLVGWAAVTGELSLTPLYLFCIVFLWTPPHFWALALVLHKDYVRSGIPMLPVVKGIPETKRQILLYSVALTGITTFIFVDDRIGWMYLCVATILNALLLLFATQLVKTNQISAARKFFRYSILYLTLLFIALMLESLSFPIHTFLL